MIRLRQSANKAFSLIEIMIVIIVLGILAAFAIPSYQKTKEAGEERTAAANLKIIENSLEQYKNQNGTYPTVNCADVTAVNTTFGLSIIAEGVSYTCLFDTFPYECKATHSSGWDIHIRSDEINKHVHCNTGTCPTCKNAASGGCGLAGG